MTRVNITDKQKAIGDSRASEISLRDWFAGMALQGILAGETQLSVHHNARAAICYDMADAMLKASDECQ